MRQIFYIILPAILCGCGTLPGSWSAYDDFSSEHPNTKILTLTKREVITDTPPKWASGRYADFVFSYRDSDGAEHEEVWHYNHSIHGWYFVKKEQIR
jgi:hypothetical protein